MKPRKVVPDTRNQVDDFVCRQITDLGYEVVRGEKNCYKLAYGDFVFSDNILCAVDIKSSGDGVEELAGNLCNAQEHARIREEIAHCAEFGGELCFLIVTPYAYIRSVDDLDKWQSPVFKRDGEGHKAGDPHVKVRGSVLKKILQTMSTPNRYGEGLTIYFRFCNREDAGRELIDMLTWFADKK